MKLGLGKLPARHDSVKFKFQKYFDLTAIKIPRHNFGRYWKFPADGWGALGNLTHGDCVFAGAAHETMLWGKEQKRDIVFDDSSVLASYSDLTGYDPENKDTDQGVDAQDAASYRRRVGILSADQTYHKIDAYVALRPRNFDQLRAAMYLFGAVGIGFEFPRSADRQYKDHVPWSVVSSKIEGGHYVPGMGIVPVTGNIACVTWGHRQDMTPEFYEHYNDESIAYLSLERLKNRISPDGFDYDTLKADLASLG